MQSINAFSLAPCVRRWLANTRDPRILHVFDHACNLINERGEVLSVVTRQIGNGPFNLVIAEAICFSDHLGVESPISIFSNRLNIGGLILSTVDAKLWDPRPDWEVLHTKRNQILDQIKQLPITNYLKNSELLLPPHLTSSLSFALANSDLPTITSINSQLAGLGIGLTPSGDDVMMGAIYAVWIIHPSDIASVLARAVANTAAPLTTSLSAAWLRAAARGEAGMVWHEFFDGLFSNDPLKLQKTLQDILAVGETSGADALAGFTGVFEVMIKKAGSLHG